MKNDFERILVSERELDEICTEISNKIKKDYQDSNKKLVLICILKGSLMFTTELMKRIDCHVHSDLSFDRGDECQSAGRW